MYISQIFCDNKLTYFICHVHCYFCYSLILPYNLLLQTFSVFVLYNSTCKVRKYVYNFRNRLETSDNVIILGIYLSHITFQSGIWDWWRHILSP